ncbi:outer membrane beta-barrel protein [Pseudoflavitalea rhizosphaerae]|uniref:outer membrane beta-barrel protein n=1 Tax=Pseudoflavitalea rhizosphaerae TaxID=1884793 RepID=UPI000F8EBA59|nr:outer membrane beta-barrel protein [Pseudoflavitalea rhizosphaerae]
MRTIFLFLFFTISISDLVAQGRFRATVGGQIKDIQNEPVSGATVNLLMAGDSTVVMRLTSANNGSFELKVGSPGIYLLAVSAISMEPFISLPFTIDSAGKKLQWPAIILRPQKKSTLKEVVVTAKKPLLEYDLDKTIVNVESMIGAAAGSSLEVLEKTPGVTVDNNGEITMNGMQSVTVLIDGRPTYMSGRDLAAYLRSLPGSLLEKIELITNPPAKYDANGGTLINIKLKKKRTQGYAGSATHNSNIGKRYRTYNSINLNYLNRKVNYFGNFSYSRYTERNKSADDRAFFTSGGQRTAATKVENDNDTRSDEFSARLGMDYNLNKKTTLGFILNGNTRKRNDGSEYTTRMFSTNNIPDSTGRGNNSTHGRWEQFGANANMQHRFTEKGEEITADLNYIRYNNRSTQDLNNYVEDQSGQVGDINRFLYMLPYSTDVFTARMDYSLPLKNKASFSTGLKSGLVKNNHQSDYFSIPESKPVPDYSKSNHFIYREYIHAVYANGRKNWKRFGLQLGLRWEYTQTKGNQLGNEVVAPSVFRRNYHSLFPSFFTSYKLDSVGRNTLALSYARRINRPGYQQLNPFLFFIDQYSYSTGNPMLNPTIAHRFELNWRYKQLLTTRLLYERQDDGIANATRIDKNTQINRPENFASRDLLALLINLSVRPAKWWNLNFHIAGARFSTNGKLYSQSINLQLYTWRTQIQNQFSISKTWSADLYATYQAPNINFQTYVKSRHWVNAAVQKKVLKNKGSIKLNLEDIFHSMGTREENRGLVNAYSFRTNDPDTRRIAISFSYNFGKEIFSRKRKYNDDAADELKERAQ